MQQRDGAVHVAAQRGITRVLERDGAQLLRRAPAFVRMLKRRCLTTRHRQGNRCQQAQRQHEHLLLCRDIRLLSMSPSPLLSLLLDLRDAKFRDLAGARVSASIPISEPLLNSIVAATMPKNLPVREVSVRPEQSNRFSVRISPKAAFLPQLTVKLAIA